MQAIRKIQRASLSTRLWCDENRLMVFEVKGLVTVQEGALIVRELKEGMRLHRPLAILADYRGACMCADPRDMVQAIDDNDGQSRSLMEPPAAALVSGGAVQIWREYSYLMARRGYVRQAFTEGGKAASWLADRARAMGPGLVLASLALNDLVLDLVALLQHPSLLAA